MRCLTSIIPVQWRPEAGDSPHFEQAASLRLAYYFTQITAHRLYIARSHGSGEGLRISLPSLTICVTASRAACRVLETYLGHGYSGLAVFHISSVTWYIGITLCLGIWIFQKQGLQVEVERHIEDVERCKRILGQWEKLWFVAGRYRYVNRTDSLVMLTSKQRRDVISALLPKEVPLASTYSQTIQRTKRGRDTVTLSQPGIPDRIAPVPDPVPSHNLPLNAGSGQVWGSQAFQAFIPPGEAGVGGEVVAGSVHQHPFAPELLTTLNHGALPTQMQLGSNYTANQPPDDPTYLYGGLEDMSFVLPAEFDGVLG